MIGEKLDALPAPNPGDRVTFMGNTGEGKTWLAKELLLSQPDVIVINTKHDPDFESVGHTIDSDSRIFNVGEGRYDWRPSDAWQQDREKQNQFFLWALKAGDRVIYIDEFNDICPSAQTYPWGLQKLVKQGRWKRVGLWGSAQEPVRVPSFCFGQSQHRYLFYLGWDPHRKAAEEWFQMGGKSNPLPWDMIPERSHEFLLKTTAGVFGPMKV